MKKKIYRDVEEMLKERESLKAALLTKIEKSEKEAENACREMEKATKADDETAFIKSADKERFYNSVIANCKERLTEMENTPKEEVNATIEAIKAAADEIEIETAKRAASVLKTFCDLATDAEKEIDDLQKLAAKYAMETRQADPVTPQIKRSSELFALCETIKRNKNRINANVAFVDALPANKVLYSGIK